jgi:hypothetical protein
MNKDEIFESVSLEKGWETVDWEPVPDAAPELWRMMAQEQEPPVAYMCNDGGPVYEMAVVPIMSGLAFRVETADPDYDAKVSGGITALNQAMETAKEMRAANRFNCCTSTAASYIGPDGVPLASERHPMGAVPPQSNLIREKFGAKALEQLAINLMRIIDWRGAPNPYRGPFELLIHPAKCMEAEWILSEQSHSAPNNDLNTNGITKIIANPHFTNTEMFALRSEGRHPFRYLPGLKRTLKKRVDGDSTVYRMIESYAFYEDGWHGFACSVP